MTKTKDYICSCLDYELVKDMEPDINVDNVEGKPITFLQNKCRNFLSVYKDMEKVNGMGFHLVIPKPHPWYGFLYHLFSAHHQHWDEKTLGDSIKYFYAGRSSFDHGRYGTPCFFFVLDHLPTDYEENHLGFSTLSAKPRPKGSIVKEACRHAIRSDIEQFRGHETARLMSHGNYNAFSRYQVHHSVKPFDSIFDEWANANGGIDYLYEQILPTEQSSFETRFKDEALSESFREYHRREAVLVLLTKEEHNAIHRSHNIHNL